MSISLEDFNKMQIEEMNRHKYLESEKAGRDLGQVAIFEWVNNHAKQFRDWVEKTVGPILKNKDELL